MRMLALRFILALAAPLAAPAEALPGFAGVHVVVRTADGLVTGHDLRYGNGQFRLRQRDAELALAEEKVTQVQFVEPDPVILLAVRLAHLRRGELVKRLFFGEKARELAEEVFLRPEEPLAETFHRRVPQMWHPDLAAALCIEAAHRCLTERRLKDAILLFEAAETASKARPDHAFVYALMRVAVLSELARPEGTHDALRQLEQKYPDRRQDLDRFRKLLFFRKEGDRPFPPRPLKGLKDPPAPAP